MLNDGTAVVFYLLFLDLATGATYSTGEIVGFFAQMALGGPAIGVAVAAASVWWGQTCASVTTMYVIYRVPAVGAIRTRVAGSRPWELEHGKGG